MDATAPVRLIHRKARRLWHLRHRIPHGRKYLISLLLLVVMVAAQWWLYSSPETTDALPKAIGWGVVFLSGAVLTTDYAILDLFGLSGVFDWIRRREDIVDSVERYYHAKRYVESHSGDSRIPVTYWRKGKFRAHVESDHVREGMRFWVKTDVPTGNPDDGVDTPLFIGTVSLDRLQGTNESGVKEGVFSVLRWESSRSAVDAHEKRQYKAILPKVWRGDGDVDLYLTVRMADELELLTLEEWEALYDGLDAVGDDVLG